VTSAANVGAARNKTVLIGSADSMAFPRCMAFLPFL
jgi:hypothetical protein